MLEFLIESILVIFGGRGFQQTFDILMVTIRVSRLTDLFLFSYEANFIQGILKKKHRNYLDPLISRSAIYMMSFH